jgi:hypothetical protein
MKQRIIICNDVPDIYLYEQDCGYEPKGGYKEYDSLKEAIKDSPRSKIHRYPSKDIYNEF